MTQKNHKILDKSPETIQTMFNLIANKYDLINNVMSFGLHNFIKKQCIKNLDIRPENQVIDLCTGTGDLAELVKKIQPKSFVTGIDFSEKMLEIARKKHPKIKFFQGDVSNLPYEDNYFDYAIMSFGLRNIQNTEKAIEEVFRILKPNGKFLHLDFGEKNLLNKIFDKIVPTLTKLFTQNYGAYSYLIKSKQAFLSPQDLIKDFESKGFKLLKRNDFLLGAISSQIMTANKSDKNFHP